MSLPQQQRSVNLLGHFGLALWFTVISARQQGSSENLIHVDS
jgi:hypothetical protein